MAHHGNTPAAWTGVLIILVGFVVGGLALVIGSWPMFWVGVVIARRRPDRRQDHAEAGHGRRGRRAGHRVPALSPVRP